MSSKTYKEFVEQFNLPPHLAKLFDESGNLKDKNKQKSFEKMMAKTDTKKIRQGQDYQIKDVTPKGYGINEDIGETFSITFKQFIAEASIRQGLPHITSMDHHQFGALVHDGKVHLHDMTEKTDGQTHKFGYDEHGFYTQSSGSGSEKMRKPEDYQERARRRAEETGKPLDLTAASAFGHIHKILHGNQKLQDHLKDKYKKSGKEVSVRGESFYRPWGREGDKPGEVKFVGTSYDTSHMGKVGKYVIHSKLPENQDHDVEHFKKHLSNEDINFDDDKIDHKAGHVDVSKETEGLRHIDNELLSSRTTKTNKERKEEEQRKLQVIKDKVSSKVDEHIKKQGLRPRWGSGSEGIVIHPSKHNPSAPRFKVTSDAFRSYKKSDESKKLMDRSKNDKV